MAPPVPNNPAVTPESAPPVIALNLVGFNSKFLKINKIDCDRQQHVKDMIVVLSTPIARARHDWSTLSWKRNSP
jgi:hypothetical protein